jgi:hypothetical protein
VRGGKRELVSADRICFSGVCCLDGVKMGENWLGVSFGMFLFVC